MNYYKSQNKSQEVKNIEDLIQHYGKREFSSPLRSTIPLISLFFYNTTELKKIIPSFKNQDFDCMFEYETKVQKGKGKSFFTDLMIFNNEKAFGIEAKRTEGKYQSAEKWLNSKSKENRLQVLSGWLDLINARCKTSLKINDVKFLPYQMIHRFASVCKISENSELMYFGFSLKEKMLEYYKHELKILSDLSNQKVPVKLILLLETLLQVQNDKFFFDRFWWFRQA